MYISPLKAIIVEALRHEFDDTYPVEYFRNVNIQLDYPVAEQGYPAIFVAYDDVDSLRRVGLSHVEYEFPLGSGIKVAPFTRWRFRGNISLTVMSIASPLERDELYDEMVGAIAFGRENVDTIGRFHTYVNNNDLIATILQTDIINSRGAQAAPGTPWGTDQMMFERTLDIEVYGEFIPDMATNTLVDLAKIIVTPESDVTDVLSPDDPITIPRMGF